MKSIFLILFLLSPVSIYSQSSNLQLGMFIGGQGSAGIASKIWIDRTKALDVAVSYFISGETGWAYLHSDFLKHYYSKFKVQGGKLPLYWGLGVRSLLGSTSTIGARFPAGASYLYGKPIFDVFFEIAPYIDFLPDLSSSLEGAVGIRFFF